MIETKYLIVGAGITSLAFADWVHGSDYLIFEADAEVGGYCKTIEQDGFIWDYSGHFFHFRSPEVERYLIERMGDQKVRVVEKKSDIHWPGGAIDFPFQKNIHQLPKELFIECLVDLYFKDGGGAEKAEAQRSPENFEQMLYAKFGRSIAELFLVPYNRKLYATDLGELDVNAMGRFFPFADIADIIGNFRKSDNSSYNATFTYPEGGAIQYVNALLKGVDEGRIHLNERIESVDLVAKEALTSTGQKVGYEHLISAAPFPKLLQMTGVEHDPSVFSWNKVLIFNLGFDRKGPTGVNWRYFPQSELCFYRVGFYDNIFETDRMSLYVELGYAADAKIDGPEVERMRLQVLEDLKNAGVVDDHELVSWHTVTLDPAYVHITEQSIAEVNRLKRALAVKGVHSMGRYGSWTYCSIEDNILEARALAEAFNT